MKFKIEFDKEDMKKMKLEKLILILKYFNRGNMEAYFKRRGNEMLEIVIKRKEVTK